MNSAVCLLERSCALYPDNKAVSDSAVSYTYAELRDRARRAASALIAALESRAPVMVYLPKGAQWTDLHTGKTYAGGQTLACDAPLERIPVFLRDGSHPDWIGKI